MTVMLETPQCAVRSGRTRTTCIRAASVLLTLFVVGSTILFVARSHNEFRQALRGIDQATPHWIAVTLLLQAVVVALIGVKYQLLLRRLGYELPVSATSLMQLRRHTIGSILPFGGASSLVTFARDLGRYGVTTEDAVFAAGLSSLTSEIAFAAFLLPVLGGLVITGEVTGPMLAGSLVMIGLASLLAVAVLVICRMGPEARLCRRLPRKLVGVVERASAHGVGARDLLLPVVLNLGVNLVGVATLYASCHAVGVAPSLWTILAGRAIGSVFTLVAPFMQGTGAVELSVTAILRQSGVPAASALAAVLVFRVAQFWFPVIVGALAYVRIDRPALVNRRRLIGQSTVLAGCVATLVVAKLLARPDLDRPTLEDEAGIFWGALLGATVLFGWVLGPGSVGRLRRAFARQRID